MTCTVLPAADLDEPTRWWLVNNATREGSDFQRTLARQLKPDGTIALVRSDEGIVGWVRTETWRCGNGWAWPTLEAFVLPAWRRRGVAAFATSGLLAFLGDGLGKEYACAVFAPSMLVVACRAGLRPTLFQQDDSGKWVRGGE